jgi:hypothetical protein
MKFIKYRSYSCVNIGSKVSTFKVNDKNCEVPEASIICDHLESIDIRNTLLVNVATDIYNIIWKIV